MPVLPLVRMRSVDDAIEFAVECEHGFRHTAIMHSLNIKKLSKMARMMNCSIFVKNGPFMRVWDMAGLDLPRLPLPVRRVMV
jgi:acyl-CoA reductase-like NAD-dependent aldehyde dehydrogenase